MYIAYLCLIALFSVLDALRKSSLGNAVFEIGKFLPFFSPKYWPAHEILVRTTPASSQGSDGREQQHSFARAYTARTYGR